MFLRLVCIYTGGEIMKKNIVIFSAALALTFCCGPVLPSSAPASVSNTTVKVSWTTEPMAAPSPERLHEVNFGASDSVSVASSGIKNRRYTSLKISAFGKQVPISGWMYLDLANPSDAPYVAYGNKDGISIVFRVGEGGAAWDVTFRLVPQTKGYKVLERKVCDAEMKPDVCVTTYNSIWQFE